jgi:hypothetical protein
MKNKYTLREIRAVCALHGWHVSLWNVKGCNNNGDYVDNYERQRCPWKYWGYLDVIHDRTDKDLPKTYVVNQPHQPLREALRALHEWAENGFKGKIT